MDKPIYRRYCACCSFNTRSPAARAFARGPIAENGPKGACARPVAPWLGRPGGFAAQQPSSPALGPLRVAHAWALGSARRPTSPPALRGAQPSPTRSADPVRPTRWTVERAYRGNKTRDRRLLPRTLGHSVHTSGGRPPASARLGTMAPPKRRRSAAGVKPPRRSSSHSAMAGIGVFFFSSPFRSLATTARSHGTVCAWRGAAAPPRGPSPARTLARG